MPLFMLDTDICIYIQKRRDHRVHERFRAVERGAAVMSTVTWGELNFGAEKSSRRMEVFAALNELRTIIPIVALPEDAGAAYGRIRMELQSSGKPIGNNDLWIAAHALAEGLTLVTNNEREFGRIEGLKIENWARA